MTTKADFNAEEWSTVVEGPLFAAVHVIAASRGGTIRESMAVGRVYQEARKQHGQSPLLDELVASPPGIDPQQLSGGGDLAATTLSRLREAVEIVGQKASGEETAAYRRFALDVAEAAARAHKEGGFIGIGGKEISEEERAALDELEGVLGDD